MAFRNLLLAAGGLIEGGQQAAVCIVLEIAYVRSDGLPDPRDMIAGDARAELNGLIGQLMVAMGCPSV